MFHRPHEDRAYQSEPRRAQPRENEAARQPPTAPRSGRTRGGLGWMGKPPGARPDDLTTIRSAELADAATVLGLAGVTLWDYPDGGVPDCDQEEITARLSDEITRVRPDAVVGWGPSGGYGHPDHISVGRCTDAAVAALAPRERPVQYHLVMDQFGVDATL